MNKTILLLFLTTQVFSQKISLFLKNDNFDLQNREFYINEIRDERPNKEVGMLNVNGVKVPLVCIPDVRFEVRNYLKKMLSQTSNTQKATILVIKDFSLKETSLNSTVISVVFDYLYFDFNQNKEILVKSTVQRKSIQTIKIGEIESAFKEILQMTIMQIRDVKWDFLQTQKNVITYSPVSPYTDISLALIEFGNFNRGVIGKGTYAHNLRIKDETGVGRCFTYGMQFPAEFDNKEAWTEISILVGGDFYKRIKNSWFGNFALHFPMGIVKTEKATNLFIGLTTHQRIMSIRHYGTKFSFGTFQTVSSHPFSPLGIGFTLGVGWANPNDDKSN